MVSDERNEHGSPPRWHDVLGPVRTVWALFWLQWLCIGIGWVLVFAGISVWFVFESTRGRHISYSETTAEQMGFEDALANPTETAVLVFVCGIVLLVGSVLVGGLRDRVTSHYVD